MEIMKSVSKIITPSRWMALAVILFVFSFSVSAEITVSVSTDQDRYAQGEPIEILITAHNSSSSDIELTFPSSAQVFYTLDGSYTYPEVAADVITYRTVPANGSTTWTIIHDWRGYYLDVGTHSLTGILDGWGETSDAVSFEVYELATADHGLTVSVSADKERYAQGEPIEISVTAHNPNSSELTLAFGSSLQSSYTLNGILGSPDTGADVITYRRIPANGEITWSFTHDWEQHSLSAGSYSLVGIVDGLGESTETVTFEVYTSIKKPTVSVSMNKERYFQGEPIEVVVTAHNPNSSDLELTFPSSMTALYTVDDTYTFPSGAADVVTYLTIPAYGEVTVHLTHEWGEYYLDVGLHSLVGALDERFEESDAVVFEVYEFVDVSAENNIDGQLSGLEFESVAYSEGRFVAVDKKGTVVTSVDAVNWSLGPKLGDDSSQNTHKVKACDGVFVILSGSLISSNSMMLDTLA